MEHKLHVKEEKFAAFVALLVLLFEMLVFTAVFKEKWSHRPEVVEDTIDENSPTPMTELDIITIVFTIVILVTAISYWLIFYHGIFKKWCPNLHVRAHCTEAFLYYTMLYMFGIGLVMPLLKYFVYGNKNFARGMYSMYPLVFLSMLFGYYLYENIKLHLHH